MIIISEISRDNNIDRLRFLGTLLIILAHVEAPIILHNIRTFDVVLLILISGMSINNSSSIKNYSTYILKRIKKLIIPLYFILTIIFLGNFILDQFLGISSRGINIETIISSFLLLDGIGYVWIVRVFLVISLIVPICWKFIREKINTGLFLIVLLLSYTFYLLLVNYTNIEKIPFLNYYFVQVFPYVIVALLGIKIYKKRSDVKLAFYISSLCFLFSSLLNIYIGESVYPDLYKYPPQPQYLFYGLSVSLLIYYILLSLENYKISNLKIANFVSRNSYDIYIYHILAIFIYNGINVFLPIDISHGLEFLIKYIFVTSLTLVIVAYKESKINRIIINKFLEIRFKK